MIEIQLGPAYRLCINNINLMTASPNYNILLVSKNVNEK